MGFAVRQVPYRSAIAKVAQTLLQVHCDSVRTSSVPNFLCLPFLSQINANIRVTTSLNPESKGLKDGSLKSIAFWGESQSRNLKGLQPHSRGGGSLPGKETNLRDAVGMRHGRITSDWGEG